MDLEYTVYIELLDDLGNIGETHPDQSEGGNVNTPKPTEENPNQPRNPHRPQNRITPEHDPTNCNQPKTKKPPQWR